MNLLSKFLSIWFSDLDYLENINQTKKTKIKLAKVKPTNLKFNDLVQNQLNQFVCTPLFIPDVLLILDCFHCLINFCQHVAILSLKFIILIVL
jgi:hypothetical protein